MEDDGTQNYLVFQPTQRYFKAVWNANNHILSRKSRGLSDGSIKPPSASANIIKSMLNYFGSKIRVEFKGSSIKQAKISFNDGKIINIYIVYEMNKNFNISSSYLTLENCPDKNILILVSTTILDMVLDLIERNVFQLVMKLVEM